MSFYVLYWPFVYLLGEVSVQTCSFFSWVILLLLLIFKASSCTFWTPFLYEVCLPGGQACFLFLLILPPPSTSNNYPLGVPVIIDVPFHFHLELVRFASNVS